MKYLIAIATFAALILTFAGLSPNKLWRQVRSDGTKVVTTDLAVSDPNAGQDDAAGFLDSWIERLSADKPVRRPGEIRHQVQRGETLWEIARRYGISVSSIVEDNQLRDPDRINEGQILIIFDPPAFASTTR